MRLLISILVILSLAILAPMGALHAAGPAIPDLATWESQMLSFGATHCGKLQDPSVDGNTKLADTYYDSERVFYQIYDYTGDAKWLGCAQAGESVYRDGYVLSNNGSVPGYWTFPHGIWYDWKRSGDNNSKVALVDLANSAGFAYAPLSWTSDVAQSREVAYNIQTKLLALEAGYGDVGRLNDLIAQAFDHMNQWFVAKNAIYIRPFMVALTSEALITLYNKTSDPRVLPTVQMAMDYIWNCCWLASSGAFMYTDRIASDGTGDMSPAPDLNLLIAPVFGWLYYMTGDPVWQQRGDTIFSAGVRVGPNFIYLGKQFNQNYRWSSDYVYWRQGAVGPLRASIGTTGLLPATGSYSGPGGGLAPTGGGSTTDASISANRNIRYGADPSRK